MSTPSPIQIRRRRDFGEILNVSLEFIKQNFRTLAKSLLVIVAPVGLLAGLAWGVYNTSILDMMQLGAGGASTSDAFPFDVANDMIIAIGAIALLGSLAGTLLSAVIYVFFRAALAREPVPLDVGDVWNGVREVIGIVLGTTIVATLFYLCAFALCFLLGIAFATVSTALLVVMFVIGCFVALYLFVPVMFVVPARVFEGVPIFEAFSRAFALTKGKWWMTFGILAVAFIIQSIIGMVFAIPQYTVMMMTMLHGIDFESGEVGEPSGGMGLLMIVTSGISMAGSFMLYAIPLVATTFQYFNLVERHDGTGLLERIDQIGAEVE